MACEVKFVRCRNTSAAEEQIYMCRKRDTKDSVIATGILARVWAEMPAAPVQLGR